MNKIRIASLLIATGLTAGVAAPASALISGSRSGGGYSHHGGTAMSRPTPMGGGCCGGGHASGSGHMSGAPYGGGSHHVTWGGRPTLGTHPMGLHFYGMGGDVKYGWRAGHGPYGGSLARKYGQWWGGHAPGGYYATAGSYGLHVPSGTHILGTHFYGMGGGSLAARYGHIEHDYGALYGTGGGSTGTSYGSQGGYGGYGSGSTPVQTWGSSPGWGHSQSHKAVFHASYKYSFKETVKRHYVYGSKMAPMYGGSGAWGSPGAAHWTYGVK